MTLTLRPEGLNGYAVTDGATVHRVQWDEYRPSCDCGVRGCVGVRAVTMQRAQGYAAAHQPQQPRLRGLV